MSHSRKIAVAVLALIGVLLFAFPNRFGNQVPRHSQVIKCLSNAKQIGVACKLYATDHDGRFPNDLDELIPDYLPDRMVFISPFAPKPGQPDYEYFGAGGKDTDPGAKILLRGRYATKDGERSVVRFNTVAEIQRQ